MDNFHQFPSSPNISLIVTSANRDRSHIRTAKRSKSIRCFAMDMKWKKFASTICWSVVSSMEWNRNCPNCQPPHQRRAALVIRSWAKSLLDAICMTLLLWWLQLNSEYDAGSSKLKMCAYKISSWSILTWNSGWHNKKSFSYNRKHHKSEKKDHNWDSRVYIHSRWGF